ncbi:hypothetical protein V2G26_018087 [Clonostachys chloroleuca]|uniref:Shikimate dehydrogenase substrate binding N-terminal domain-containing protein n=1 Tax=Clonostachys chloroleuca TaxID=1926264 RepID=A0AA35Q7A9_9HYPO|nr:unnamed protein product [Clonostachys chloroleuca]
MGSQIRERLYIAGGPGGDSIGPKVHEYVASTLGLKYSCQFLQLEVVEDVVELFRKPDFAGGLVTMPHKRTIVPYLDQYDDLVTILGACNCVYLSRDGKLHGTNTDWVGIHDTIVAATPDHQPGRIGMVYGAGGASRAAIYALWVSLKCSKVYLVNRDEVEVREVFEEIHRVPAKYFPEVVHVKTVAQCASLAAPYYTVCTVPDFQPATFKELEASDVFQTFLKKGSGEGGLVLDMCYHPRITRNLKMADQYGYRMIQGHTVSAAQFAVQWNLWTRQDITMQPVFDMVERLVREKEAALVATEVH